MAFTNAQNFGIGRATFNIFPNPQPPLSTDPAEGILRQARAVEATHTSSTASYAPKCNPETRLRVIGDIVDWVVESAVHDEDTTPLRTSILWFLGPAGGGKTCIMRDVVDRCEAVGILAVSYFFSTRVLGLSTERPFVATIVHRLITLHPILRPIIFDTIRGNPSIFEESLDFQMAKLVVEPLESQVFWSQTPYPRKMVIAIDGFDECRLERERKHLLTILLSLVTRLPHLIVIVLASRPELDIRTAFDDPKKLKRISMVLRLQDYDGTEDIRIFLCDEFEAIRETHPLRRFIPKGWPPEKIIEILLDKSSGNFIFPATLIKYISNPRRNPVDSLNHILALSQPSSPPSNLNPLADLDALYSFILHPPDTNLLLMKRILHCLLGTRDSGIMDYCSSYFLDDFLQLPPGMTMTVFCDLHSILSIPDSENEPIQFHHKSLEDYLITPERSLDLFQSPYDTHVDLTKVCIEHLQAWAKEPTGRYLSRLHHSSGYWHKYFKLCIDTKPTSASLPDIIMNVDPRIFLKYRLARGYPLLNYDKLRNTLHSTLCSNDRCLRLCQLLARISECWPKIKAFDATLHPDDIRARVAALPRFESETGLYEPLELW